MSDDENIRQAYISYLGRPASDAEVSAYLQNNAPTPADVLDIASSPEAARFRERPPEPKPPLHPDPIWGELRAVSSLEERAHYADDEGEILPVGFTWFSALDQRRRDPAGFRRTLTAAAAAGYQFARVLFAVATPPGGYWDGHEITPADPDYDELVAGLGRDFAAAGMQVFVSSGGLYDVFRGDLNACADWSRRLGSLLARSGVRVAWVDVNESWQNWITGSTPAPADIDRYVTSPFAETYGGDFIPLRSSQPGDEIAELFDAWSAGRVIQKHGHRGFYEGDFVTAVRHARGIFYDEQSPDTVRVPRVKLGIESEPVGPGSSVSTLSDPEALALLAVANLIGGFAHVFHSGNGVRWWLGAVEDEPGFVAVPSTPHFLPRDLHSAFNTITHGGLSASPFTDGRGFPTDNRVDSVLSDDGRFVTLAYGNGGHTALEARRAVEFTIYTPHTGEARPFRLQAGETLDLRYGAGRVAVGRYL
jgi:hypothetical protein